VVGSRLRDLLVEVGAGELMCVSWRCREGARGIMLRGAPEQAAVMCHMRV